MMIINGEQHGIILKKGEQPTEILHRHFTKLNNFVTLISSDCKIIIQMLKFANDTDNFRLLISIK